MSSFAAIYSAIRVWPPENKLWKLLQPASMEINEEAIISCVDAHPEYCSSVKNDKLPIHIAIEKSLSVDVIRRMLICFPQCCMIPDPDSYILLHTVLRESVGTDVVMLIINTCHEAVRYQNRANNHALHIECDHQCRYDVVIRILEIYPEAISIACLDGNLPLHLSIRCVFSQSKVVLSLMTLYPNSVSIRGCDCYPLHYECINKCRYNIIMKLLEINPEAIRIPYGVGLPLHQALVNVHVRSEVILHLINLYPEAASISNMHDIYSLHQALKSKQLTSNIILHLINLHPDAVHIADVRGYANTYPLHIECSKTCRFDVINKLLEIYPEAMRFPYLNTPPLHFVARNVTICHMIPKFLSYYPDAVRMPDATGNLIFQELFSSYYASISRYGCKANYALSRIRRDVLVEVLNLYPEALNSVIFNNKWIFNQEPKQYRCLLNLAYHHVASTNLICDYRDLNWKSRSPLLYLIHQLALSSTVSNSDRQPNNDQVLSTVASASSMICIITNKLLENMVGNVGRIRNDDRTLRFDWMTGDDLGCILLRHVMLYV